MEGLEAKLQDSVQQPAQDKYRLGQLISQKYVQRKTVLIAEVARLSKEESSSALADRAAILREAGVHALSCKTDAYDTPTGLQDLFSVVNAVPLMPVLRRDWFIHPLQLIESKEAGAAGVLGIVCQVSGKGTPLMSSFASTLGLDAPVEVVNQTELDFLVDKGVPMFAINCGVGLSLAVPGLSSNVAGALLGGLPLNCAGLVGVNSTAEAKQAVEQGATALLLKEQWVASYCEDRKACREVVADLKYELSFDD